MSEYRAEKDSVGELKVPSGAYYGVQTLRAAQNFQITGRGLHPLFIENLVKIKLAAAKTNHDAKLLETHIYEAITAVCEEILSGKLRDEFIVDSVQGGAGTSANMNANEVIANRATELCGGTLGSYSPVHPNDHVNMAQSTNDVYPTAGKLTLIALTPPLIAELNALAAALRAKAAEFTGIVKMGRTQLQDAVPMRLSQTFGAYASAVERTTAGIIAAERLLHTVNMGATAIGNGINASRYYYENIARELSAVTGVALTASADMFDGTQNADCYVSFSGSLKACAVSLSKICNDLRLLSSGPKTGIGEITLPARQNGSSIMPGKINPVIPEVVTQVAFGVIGNDATVTAAAEAGQLELNAFEPILFTKLIESLTTMTGAVHTLTANCILGIVANCDRCRSLVEQSVGIATALCPYLGYKKSAEIAKECLKTGKSVRQLTTELGLIDETSLGYILNLSEMCASPSEHTK